MGRKDTIFADERRFLDDRYDTPLAPNGLNPATIMEKAVRDRIINSFFFKDRCFALNEADIVDRVVEEVRFIGGTYGVSQKPTPFLCLAFKLLQLAPSDAIVDAYLAHGGEKFKYLRALACFYVRLTRQAKDIYLLLEPHLADYRKLRIKRKTGTAVVHMDEFVDNLLTKDRVCATSLWKMAKRDVLEDLEVLEPRVSKLGDIEELLEEDDEDMDVKNGASDESDGEVYRSGRESDSRSDGEVDANGDRDRERREMDLDDD